MKPLHSALILISLVSSIYTVRFLSSTSEPSDPNQTPIESPIGDVATSAQELFCSAVYLTENFTEHQYNTASGIQNFVGGLRKGNSLLWYLQNNYSMNQIYHNYWKEILPYTALGLFLLVISIVMFCCFCFKARCCKPCLEADETKVTRWVTIGLIFSVLIVAASAIGIEAALNAKANFQAANCAAITLISEFSTGNQTKNWTGLANMVDNLTTVSQLYEPAIQGLPVVDTDSSSVDNAYAQLNTSIYQYWTNNSNITVTNPQRPTQQLTPTFIQNLGPINDDPTTYAGSLLQEAQSHYLLFSTSLEEAHASIQHLNDTVDTSQAAINNAIPYLTDFNQLIEVISLRYQHAGKIALTISQDLGDGLFGFFIFATTISVFTFLIVVNIILCQFTFFQRCFKFTYICLYLTLFICFVILIIGFPILIVLGEGCSVAQASLTDAGTFQSAMNTFFRNYSRVTTYTNTCFFDDGDIPTTYGIASPLIQFNSLYQTIVTVNETVLETPNSLILPGQQQMIRSIKFYDVSTNTEIDNALTEFNKFTNYQASETYQISCRVSQDTWYLNETNCTAANGVEFDGSDASFNFPNATCLGFSNFGSLNYSDRYKAASFSGCGQVSGEDFVDYITQFAGNFTTYINDVKSGFAQMSSSFGTVNQNNVHFMNAGMNLMDSISGINGSSLTVTQIIGDPIGGIYPNSNCKSAHDNAEVFVDNFCVGYLPSVGLIMLLALLYAIFGMVLLYPLITMDKLEKKRAEQKKKYDESLVRLGELY